MKDVVLIGLGEFGKKTIEVFREIETERKNILSADSTVETVVWPVVYCNNSHFNYTQVSKGITELVDSSESKKGKKPFSYIFIGDLYEDITSNYALDYAMIPLILEKDNILLRDKDSVLGFFTFSDRLETQKKCTSEKMTSILSFFKRIEAVTETGKYFASYKNISGKTIGDVMCNGGPFSRNYLVVTPGDEDDVLNTTTRIFAERIFYELYYNLLNDYKNKPKLLDLPEKQKNRCFSSFTMVEISRLAEQQRYYLTYCLADKVLETILQEKVRLTNLDALENKFLSMIDIIEKNEESICKRENDGYRINFPIEKAVSIFEKNYSFFGKQKKGIIKLPYVGVEHIDEKKYIDECKQKLEDKLEDAKLKYGDFVRKQIADMNDNVFAKAYVKLFQINKLNGNIHAYIRYVTDLKNIFESWNENLQEQIDSIEEINISNDFENAQAKIKQYQDSFIYKLPFFRPIRILLIKNTLFELAQAMSVYFENEIKLNLLDVFLTQWNDYSATSVSPVKICKEVINGLNIMKERLETKRNVFRNKKEFIYSMPDNYYIISQLEQEEYSNLLKKLYTENLEGSKNFDIDDYAKDFFYQWTTTEDKDSEKNWHDIVMNPTGFINSLDKYLSKKSKDIFKKIRIDPDKFEEYAANSKEKLLEKVEDLSCESFNTSSCSIKNEFLFSPKLDIEDRIDECLKSLSPETIVKKMNNKDFSLGAVVYFQDFLYMEYKNLRHYETLFKNYENEKDIELNYVEPGIMYEEDTPIFFTSTEKDKKEVENSSPQTNRINNVETDLENKKISPATFVDDDELNIFNLHSRLLLNDFFDENFRLESFRKVFGETPDELSAGNINALAKKSNLTDLLNQMDIEQIHKYCKKINLEDISSSKETQIEIINTYLDQLSDD